MENSSPQSYTVGIWNAKPGKEEEFIKAWTDFAKGLTEDLKDKASGRLLQDPDNPTKFISLGIWNNIEDIKGLRDKEAFKTLLSKVDELLVDYQLPHLMKLSSYVE